MKFIKGVLSWIVPIALGLVIGLAVKQFVISASFIHGDSMKPNLQSGQMVTVLRPATIHRNSVIIFNAHGEDPQATKPTDYYVKRVIGLPGDTVSSNNGQIYVNNHQINQNYISNNQRTTGTGNWDLQSLSQHWTQDKGTVKVPQGKYFVLGDHRSVSNDSRYWGFVDKSKIEGVAKAFPFQKDANQINAAYKVGAPY
ncbi:signal peptidase I [Lentilactobacillus diolivorans]|uniref:Signal peptidase I n=1 Tax=Lentilactobacillus diolivorans TaxID=179838 RepID=A0ABQ0XFG0_9LACO|nr:signal peptidase I [Lentilactobacillus diolivorans]GEP24740.1 signal peptidase I [Lentilactobacillus diolivorans]